MVDKELDKLKLQWWTGNKTSNYIEKNKRLSEIDNLIYLFLKDLYYYLIDQNNETPDYKLYLKYINLINISLCNNREEPSQKILDIFLYKAMYILKREQGPQGFILVGLEPHLRFMKEAILKIRSISSPEFYGFATQEEFTNTIKAFKIKLKEKDYYEKISN